MDDPMDRDFDPWEDTTAHRAPEREDPFDDGSTEGPFGALSEVAGVPRTSAGIHHPRTDGGAGLAARVLLAVLVVLAASSAVVWLF